MSKTKSFIQIIFVLSIIISSSLTKSKYHKFFNTPTCRVLRIYYDKYGLEKKKTRFECLNYFKIALQNIYDFSDPKIELWSVGGYSRYLILTAYNSC